LEAVASCPRQFHEVKVLKNYQDVKGDAALWGDRVHEALEEYLNGTKDLPVELEMYRGYADAIKRVPGTLHVELKLAIDTQLNPCEFFNGANMFSRGVCDVFIDQDWKGKAIDHKTGKRKKGSRQMRIMALLLFLHFPKVQEIDVMFAWLKTNERDTETIKRDDIPAIWLELMPELRIFKERFDLDVWPARKSGLCKQYCAVTSCEHNGRNR